MLHNLSIDNLETKLSGLPRWLLPVGLFLLSCVLYANTFPGTFVLDDIHIAQNNPLVKNPDLLTILRSDYWHGYENSGLFRPLTILSLALNRMLLGEGVVGFHLVNVLLHATVTVVFWQLLRRWGLSLLTALLAAGLFAAHPIHGEVVNVVVGRSELLSTLLVLGALLCADNRRYPGLILAGLCFLGAMLSKENAITLLLLLPAADAFRAGSLRVWRQRWPLYAGLLAVALVWLAWRSFGVVSELPRSVLTEAAAPLAYVDNLTRVLTALSHQWLYLKIHLWPIPLQSVYSVADLPPFIASPFSLAGLLVLAATTGLLWLLVYGLHRGHLAAFFGLLYILAFSITTNILFPIGVTMAERLAYLPSLWFCAALAALLLGEGQGHAARRVGLLLGCAFVLFFAVTGLVRNRDFASEPHLWMAEVRQNPEDFLAWQNVGEVLNNQQRFVEAEAAYHRMLALAPDYPGGLRSWTFYLLTRSRFEEALTVAEKVRDISVAQQASIALAFDSLNVAEALLGLGRYQQALKELENATQLLYKQSRYNELRARLLNALERDAEALEAFGRVSTIAPLSNLHLKMAVTFLRLQRFAEAHERLLKDIEVRGDQAETLNLLGVVAANQKRWLEATGYFARAVALEPENRYYRENWRKAQQGGE